MSYFGGRKITEVDLEAALLVGMSPHERRRLEKKKGLSLKHSAGSVIPNMQDNVDSTETSSAVDTSEVYILDGFHSTKAEACSRNENTGTDADFSDTICADSGIDGEVSYISGEDLRSDKSGVSYIEGAHVVHRDDNCRSPSKETHRDDNCRSSSKETVESYHMKDDETAQPKHNSKLSLLGHGPHGKQVVDHLLKEYGDDGIHQFCQRWRQVFVEALQPRFLPSGWDVMHRYADQYTACVPFFICSH